MDLDHLTPSQYLHLSILLVHLQQAMNENFFRKIHRKGIMVVAAAGNNGHVDDAPPMIPAAFPTSTISIGAVNLQKKRHYMSAVNSQVELCAVGTDVISTGFDLVNGRYHWDYAKKTGSSMAAPQVAAVVSLLWSHFPACSGDQIRSVLAKTAIGHRYSYGPCDDNCGFGIPQLQDAYDLLDSTRTYPGSNDYNCNVAGLILSSTNNVCDCVNSRGDPSKCLDVSSRSGASKVSQYQHSSSNSSTRCADDSSARFKLAVSSRNLQIQILNRKKNRNNNKKRNRRKVTRGCKFVAKASYSQIIQYCRNTKVRQSCKRTCSYSGFEYADCTF